MQILVDADACPVVGIVEKIAKQNDKNSFIPLKYIDILNEGLKNYDESFVNNFKICLQNMPFPIKEGTYTFSDPIQHNAATQGKK